jgi:hypothetical protein
MVMLLPCSLSGTSIADPATRTESTCGAIFKCTVSGAGRAAGQRDGLRLETGRGDGEMRRPVSASFSVKPPAWSVVVWELRPTG